MNTKMKMKPKLINQTVLIRHRSVTDKGGKAQLKICKQSDMTVSKIKAVYMDGKVQTTSGDVWTVQPSSKCDWETVESVDL